MAKIVKITSLLVTAVAIQFFPFAAEAASSCAIDQQWDREALTRCIDELRKQIKQDRADIEALKDKNALLSKQLCMVAIEQHRRNAHSEALKLIIEQACTQFKNSTAPEEKL